MAWGLNADQHADRIKWVKGPAGVGKSVIAQSCVDELAKSQRLGASFFFSRPNNRFDPTRFFPTLAYQLAVKFRAFGDLLDELICLDPTLLRKSIPSQFDNLIVVPLGRLKSRGDTIPERVVIVDGLDECGDGDAADAQMTIVKIIAQSVRDNITPFLWMFFSRFEPHLVTMFKSLFDTGLHITHVELVISREMDDKIYRFLKWRLTKIGEKHSVEVAGWPSDRDVLILVDLSSGQFAYAYAALHFIDDGNSNGPVHQLQIVLELAKHKPMPGESHPLANLDHFYTELVLKRIPSEKIQTVQHIILVSERLGHLEMAFSVRECPISVLCANILGLSEDQYRNVCSSLHAVAELTASGDGDLTLSFHHPSFVESMTDRQRLKEFSVWSNACMVTLLDQVLDLVNHVQVGFYDQENPSKSCTCL
jgi:hypothetical protein